ncbi:MAG TPA: GNAT family protein [Caulobacteraceae bacterium]
MSNIHESRSRLPIGSLVSLRRIEAADLPQIYRFPFTVSIREPLDNEADLKTAFEETGFWTTDAGAIAIVASANGRFLGTAQFYRAAPCIHGLELGYIIHQASDRGQGAATQAVRLLTDYLFVAKQSVHRIQLLIEAWNVPSWKLAERCAFVREGLLRSAGFGDEPADCYVYSRTRTDWREEQNGPLRMGL